MPRLYFDHCQLQFLDESPPAAPRCLYGDLQSQELVVLFGDSHAAQWFPAVEAVAQEMHWQLLSRTKAACPAASLGPSRVRQLNRNYVECTHWRPATIAEIIRLRPSVVFMANSAAYFRDEDGLQQVSLSEWALGLKTTLEQFSRAGIAVLLFDHIPWPGFDVPACLDRPIRNILAHADCSFERTHGRVPGLDSTELKILRSTPLAMSLSLTPDICPAEHCEVVRDGLVLYRDKSHITASFSKALSASLLKQVRQALVAIEPQQRIARDGRSGAPARD